MKIVKSVEDALSLVRATPPYNELIITVGDNNDWFNKYVPDCVGLYAHKSQILALKSKIKGKNDIIILLHEFGHRHYKHSGGNEKDNILHEYEAWLYVLRCLKKQYHRIIKKALVRSGSEERAVFCMMIINEDL